jgi:adenosylmethionine-8-amino-7-oxononanoate aminotransferase
MGFSRGQPTVGAEYADALEALLAVQDPATVAAVIVEPITGSAASMRRRRAIWSGCAPSATGTASC